MNVSRTSFCILAHYSIVSMPTARISVILKEMAQPEEAESAALDSQVGEAISRSLSGKYEKVVAVGRGSYGQVWLVERVSDRRQFVAKIMQQEKKHRSDAEIQCLASCDHFGVVKLYDNFDSEIGPVIVIEYADRGDLSKFIKNRAADRSRDPSIGKFDETFVGRVFVQLCMAVHHLHRRRMLHRDLKTANVLMLSNGIVKLSDFGFSRQFDGSVSQAVADTFLGTPYYLAPELWKRQKYGKKADVWSLGIILYEIMSLKRPFVASSMRGLMQVILAGDYEPPIDYSPELISLLDQLLQVNPDRRPSTAEILLTPLVSRFTDEFLEFVAGNSKIDESEKVKIRESIKEMRETLSQLAHAPESTPIGGEDPEEAVIFEGPIQIGSARDWKSRYLVLQDSALVVTRVKEDRRSQKITLDTVTSVSAADSANVDNVFVVALSTGYTVWMRTSTAEERVVWIDHIQQALRSYKESHSLA